MFFSFKSFDKGSEMESLSHFRKKIVLISLSAALLISGCAVSYGSAGFICNKTTQWDPVKKIMVERCETAPPPKKDTGLDPGVRNFLAAIGMALFIGTIYKTAPKEAYR